MGGLTLYQVLLQLAVTPLYLKYLGLDGYGVIGFYLVLLGISAVLDTAVSSAVCREIVWLKARTEQRQIPTLVLSTERAYWGLVALLTAAFLCVVSFYGKNWFAESERLQNQARQIGWLIGASFFISFPAGFYNGILNGHQKQVQAGLLGALAQSVRGLGAVAILAFILPDLRLFFVWNLVSGFFQTAMLRRTALGCLDLPERIPPFSWRAVESLRAFAGGMFAITGLSSISLYADRIILSKYISLAEYGTYVLIGTVLGGFSRLVTPLTLYFTPLMTAHAASGSCSEMVDQLQAFFRWICVLLVPPLVMFSLFSDEILALWTQNPHLFSGTQKLSLYLATGFLLQTACYPITTMLYAEKKISGLLQGAVGMALLTPLALMVIIPKYGSLGAALTLALCSFVYFFFILVIGSRALKKSLLFLGRNLCLSVLGAMLLTAPAFLPGLASSYRTYIFGALLLLSFTGNLLINLALKKYSQSFFA